MSFKIDICDLLGKPLDYVKAELDNPENHKKLGELKFLDFMVGDKPGQSMRHGVYLFFTPDNECAYIGKTNKQHFAERIGSHFGMQKEATGNEYLKRTIARETGRSPTFQDYICHLPKMGDHSLVMIGVHNWEHTATVYRGAGGKTNFDKYRKIKKSDKWVWGKTVFIDFLEKFLQAVYCPPIEMKEMDGEPNDHFLIKPKKGRITLRRIQKRTEKAGNDVTLAQFICKAHCR